MTRFTMILATLMVAATPIAAPVAAKPAANADHSVGAQYDTTHVYVPEAQFDAFVASFVATFGGKTSKQGEFQVTPTLSLTKSQLALTPVGTVSVFGFKTPIPYPFGDERTGYLVSDMDAAVASAVKHGAVRRIATFPDPIGRDAVVQWAGGVNMQLYWHTTKPSYAALTTVPENRIYLTSDAADTFIHDWTGFAHGRIVSDDRAAKGEEIGQPGKTIRRVAIESGYGRMTVFVSDGQLPWPYGRDVTGYEVADLDATLVKASAAGVETLVAAKAVAGRLSAMLRFPGGYIAKVHGMAAK
ncbi:glyoxalase [Sphingobium sp.]|uniref:glyoxalase n=1 Tax=Sphingobium sp. TaxID=1912891 RepID=UPI002BCC3466|nr:glyoxalase [Sphingobium sp.]HUD92350.1 glyoxalase [Sphingobium sp.]